MEGTFALPPKIAFVCTTTKGAQDFYHLSQALTEEKGCLQVSIICAGAAKRVFDKQSPSHVFMQRWGSSEIDVDRLPPEDKRILSKVFIERAASCDVVLSDINDLTATLVDQLGRRVIVYYCNPRNYVSGGYSRRFWTALRQSSAPGGVIFGNNLLANQPIYGEPSQEIHFGSVPRFSIGFWDTKEAETIRELKDRKEAVRQDILQTYGVHDTGQPVFLLIGGNNATYYESLPRFFQMIYDNREAFEKKSPVIFFRRHPQAQIEDLNLFEEAQNRADFPAQLIHTQNHFLELTALAERVFFQQSSLEVTFTLAGIPTGVLDRNPSPEKPQTAESPVVYIENASDLLLACAPPEGGIPMSDFATALQGLGYSQDWRERFFQALEKVQESNREG